MRAVVTVIGKDAVGILAKVSTKCAEYNANVIEVTQSVLQDLFAMIMLVDITKLNSDLLPWQTDLQSLVRQWVLRYTQCTRIFLTVCTISKEEISVK